MKGDLKLDYARHERRAISPVNVRAAVIIAAIALAIVIFLMRFFGV